MTLNEILQSLPAEIGRYTLAITRYLDPELEQLMWSMTYECSADGMILPGCDINEQDFEDGARKLYDWLQGHRHRQHLSRLPQDVLRNHARVQARRHPLHLLSNSGRVSGGSATAARTTKKPSQ